MRSTAVARGVIAMGAIALWCVAASATVQVQLTGSETLGPLLPDADGRFAFANVALRKNSVNTFTVTATDDEGHTAQRQISITQVSLEDVVVSELTTERLSPQRIQELVNEGVINLDNPENYNVSLFQIVLTVDRREIPVSVPISIPRNEEVNGWEVYRLPQGGNGGGGRPPSPPIEIIVFEEEIAVPAELGIVVPPLPGVIIIEGNIRTLKEFFSVRLLLMNTSGIFTLSNVLAEISFPDGGLTCMLPDGGVIEFDDIIPGDGTQPGQAEREFIVRGDEIGTLPVQVNFGGAITGPGIPEDAPIPFNGMAQGEVEVLGPPEFLVQVRHPDTVEEDVPYELLVDITNRGQLPALYTSLELDVGADADLVDTSVDPITGEIVSEFVKGSQTRTLGHIYPGETVREVFTVLPLVEGEITSCFGISDSNITLQVFTGPYGCMTGHYPAGTANDDAPTVSVLPTPNALAVSTSAPVVAFFNRPMDESTITTGSGGTFNVYDEDGALLPAELRYETMNEGSDTEKTVAIWQFKDGVTNRLAPETEFTVRLSDTIQDADGYSLANAWLSTFTTTNPLLDSDPPSLLFTVVPPVDPTEILPGELVRLSADPADQGTGVARVELYRDDATAGTAYELVDQKTILDGTSFPILFAVDSAQLDLGHTYDFKARAYDAVGNYAEATVTIVVANSAAPPTVTLAPDPTLPVLQGISINLTPSSYSRSVRRLDLYRDAQTQPFNSINLPPFQAYLLTHELALGAHTVRAVVTDGLGQTGEDMLSFQLIENPNMPVVSFGSAVDGVPHLLGTTFSVYIEVVDPVGLAAVQCFLDASKGDLITSGERVLTIDTATMGLGTHTLTVVATNLLGTQNDPSDPASVLTFEVVEELNGPAPASPVVTSVSVPNASGTVTIQGTSVPSAQIRAEVVSTGAFVIGNADVVGTFTITIQAASGDQVRLIAYDFTTSTDPSPAVTVSVPLPAELTGLVVAPSPLSFTTSMNETRTLVATANYAGGGTQNVTSLSTFHSTDTSVVRVTSAGVVAPVTNGTAAIQVTFDDETTEVPVTVNVLTATHLTLAPSPVVITGIAQTAALTVTKHFSDGSSEVLDSGVSFISNASNIATVNSAGVIRSVSPGTTAVTAYVSGLDPVSVSVTVQTAGGLVPTAYITSPPGASTVERGDVVSVVLQAEDGVPGGVSRVSLNVTGAATSSQTQQISPPSFFVTRTFTFAVPLTAPMGATISVSVTATDTDSQVSSPAVITLTVADETPPVVATVAPAANAAYAFNETIGIMVHATDAVGVVRIGADASGGFASAASKAIAPASTLVEDSVTITVPFTVTVPEVTLTSWAEDAAGHRTYAAPVPILIPGADSTPPDTEVTAVATPSGATATVSYHVNDGLSDLDHVLLYFRRNGIGTFNAYTTDAVPSGRFTPQSGANGTIAFDSTKMGGDGHYEFYTVGVDITGNREAPPSDGTKAIVPDKERDFSAGTIWTTIAAATEIGSSDATYDNKNLRIDGVVVTVVGHHAFKNVDIVNGGSITHRETDVTTEYGLDVSAWTISIDATSSIDVSGRGYAGAFRHGNTTRQGYTLGNVAGSTRVSGGSYGGLGASAVGGVPNAVYGNLVAPVDLGSGGSRSEHYDDQGGDGGGRMQIQAVNIVADGAVDADGGAGSTSGGYDAGCGSGGSIYLIVRTLSGNGYVHADGGLNEVPGGGGRVAVHYMDMATMDSGHLSAAGHDSTFDSGDGTVFLKGVDETNGTLIIDGQGTGTAFAPLPIPPGLIFDNIIIQNQARVVIDDRLVVTDTIRLLTGSVLTHGDGNEDGLDIEANHIYVDATSAIDVTARGYPGAFREGNGTRNGITLGGIQGAGLVAGGSYGGYGGVFNGDTNQAYGDPSYPVYLGSGGSRSEHYDSEGGDGGGRVTILAHQSLTVDGAIRANGGVGTAIGGIDSGCGSGGSIWIDTSFLAGAGSITAHGGVNETPGGGGRILVVYDGVAASPDDLNGLRNIVAHGANVYSTIASTCGTVMLRQRSQAIGDLVVDGGSSSSYALHATALTPLGRGEAQDVTADTLTVDGALYRGILPGGLVGLTVRPDITDSTAYEIVSNTATTITVDTSGKPPLNTVAATGDTYALEYRFDNLIIRSGGRLSGSDLFYVAGDTRVEDHGSLEHFETTATFEAGLYLETGSMYVDSLSRVDVTGYGYPGAFRHGNSTREGRTLGNLSGSSLVSGGSYGGLGAAWSGVPNPVYGDLSYPSELGSGGSRSEHYDDQGGDGGGRVRLIVSDTLTVDGAIRADGGNGNSIGGIDAGSGSGGSVWIDANTINGAGVITANGGQYESPGGGGRIALHYVSCTMTPAQLQARGWAGYNYNDSSNGTLVMRPAGEAFGTLIVDGQGAATSKWTQIPSAIEYDALTLRNYAFVTADQPLSIAGALQLTEHSVLTHTDRNEDGLYVEANTILVDGTSRIDVTGRGYPGAFHEGNDTRSGRTLGNIEGSLMVSGGSYGGYGGHFSGPGPNQAYGHPAAPVYLGSGGSRSEHYDVQGGDGGGRVTLLVHDTLTVNGKILADGTVGTSVGGIDAGCGSGGSIWIDTGVFQGTGHLNATGGFNELPGGGGRIAVIYDELGVSPDDFNGLLNITASGHDIDGDDARSSSDGTVLLRQEAQWYGDLYIDSALTGDFAHKATTLTPLGLGIVQDVSADTLTVDGQVYRGMLANALAGLVLRPNIDNDTGYTILSNSDTLIVVDIAGKPPMTTVAAAGDVYALEYRFDNLYMRRGGRLITSDLLYIGGTLDMSDYSWIDHFDTTVTYEPALHIEAGSVYIDATSKIDVSARGYPGAFRHGNTTNTGYTLGNVSGSTRVSGGSYGGLGASLVGGVPNAVYGSGTMPADLGSGGSRSEHYDVAGGDGGGRVRLIVSGAMTLDGSILANGGVGTQTGGWDAGNGSGGSIWITADTVAGSGTIGANGPNGEAPGGGGRVAVYYGPGSSIVGLDIGSGAWSPAGAGTVYLFQTAR